MIIKRIDPMSCAKITGVLYAILGLIGGAFVSLFAMVGATFSPSSSGMGVLFGVGAIIVFPIFYGVIGFLSSLIGAWLYNVLAGMVGGVRIEVEVTNPTGSLG